MVELKENIQFISLFEELWRKEMSAKKIKGLISQSSHIGVENLIFLPDQTSLTPRLGLLRSLSEARRSF